MNSTFKFLQASRQPLEDLHKVTYPGQDPMRRMYRPGYEGYFDQLPLMQVGDPLLEQKVLLARRVMQKLSATLAAANWVSHEYVPAPGGFNRTILALEPPFVNNEGELDTPVEGKEIILARWGDGHTSPVHGHAAGYIHEDIIYGKMRVNRYKMISPTSKVVRLIETTIAENGTFASMYAAPQPGQHFKRQALIHNFTSIGQSATLHYIPEHTRDGRDNGFTVQYFDDVYEYGNADLRRITSKDAMYSRKGEVILVRSANVPEYGDHYIVITGAPVMKEHGLRPQDVAIGAPNNKALDQYQMENGLTLLHLQPDARDAFHAFHGIMMNGTEVIMPTA